MEYYTIEEKILYATSLICRYEFAKAKLKLEEILETEPDNGRVHYLMGWIYFTQLCDYKNAERYFNYAMKFSPSQVDVYYIYIDMLNLLNRKDELPRISEKAIGISGVCKAYIHHQLGLSGEKNGNYSDAIRNFEKAIIHATDKEETEKFEECIQRIKNKLSLKEKFVYVIK